MAPESHVCVALQVAVRSLAFAVTSLRVTTYCFPLTPGDAVSLTASFCALHVVLEIKVAKLASVLRPLQPLPLHGVSPTGGAKTVTFPPGKASPVPPPILPVKMPEGPLGPVGPVAPVGPVPAPDAR